MSRNRQLLVIPQGTTWGMAWPVFTQDGAPADISEWVLRSQIRSPDSSGIVVHEWSTELENATTTGGMATILLTPSVSWAWVWCSGVYDVKLFGPDGVEDRIAEGPVTVSPGVTR